MVVDDFCDYADPVTSIDFSTFPSCASDADSTVSRKDEICGEKDAMDFSEVVGDIDALCGFTDEDGTEVPS